MNKTDVNEKEETDDIDVDDARRMNGLVSCNVNKNSSGDEIANVNFYAVRSGSYGIRWNNAK